MRKSKKSIIKQFIKKRLRKKTIQKSKEATINIRRPSKLQINDKKLYY